jgi:hypothetical protein
MIFNIKWEQQLIDAKDPLQAAKDCLNAINNGESVCFTVVDETGKEYSVDLSEPDDDAVLEIKK